MAIKAIIKIGHGRDCPYCGRVMSLDDKSDSDPYPTRDHIRPRAGGGGPRIIVCRRCNLDKAARSLTEWHQELTEAGDARAPVVDTFIRLVSTGGHLKIIKQYEQEANALYWKDLERDGRLLDTTKRHLAERARIKRLNRKRNRQ